MPHCWFMHLVSISFLPTNNSFIPSFLSLLTPYIYLSLPSLFLLPLYYSFILSAFICRNSLLTFQMPERPDGMGINGLKNLGKNITFLLRKLHNLPALSASLSASSSSSSSEIVKKENSTKEKEKETEIEKETEKEEVPLPKPRVRLPIPATMTATPPPPRSNHPLRVVAFNGRYGMKLIKYIYIYICLRVYS